MSCNLSINASEPALQLVIRSRDDLSDEERWQVYAWQAQTFDLREQFATVDWYVFGMHMDQWVSLCELTKRTIMVGSQPVVVMLIGSLVTVPQWRRRGYARALLQHACTFCCQQRDVAFGLLLCSNAVVAFYERCGWQCVETPLVYEQPGGPVLSDQQTMVYGCGQAEWPPGTIDLCGLPL